MARDEAGIEAEIKRRGLNAPRLTPQQIDDQIVGEYFIVPRTMMTDVPLTSGMQCITLCCLSLKNGFVVTGESACASPENFNEELGRKIARDNARNKIWALEGYLLRTKLAECFA